VEARRGPRVLDRAAQQAILERILVLVTPQPSSQRLLRRAWRSAQRLDADIDVLWVRGLGKSLPDDQTTALAALRRLAAILGAHFLEEESNDVIAAVRATVADRGSTYVYLGTPERRRFEEVVHGSFLGRLIDALPGVDIRIAADRSRRRELQE
jgi:two-component system sensor histidine kinase KdpD